AWIGSPATSSSGLPGTLAARTSAAEELARMAEAVNALRALAALPPLRLNAQLTAAAQLHADTMARTRTLTHIGPTGTRPEDRMAAAGYQTCGGGENVAFGLLRNVDDVARSWYDSPSHRDLMLDPVVREMGIGRSETADALVYWALELGLRP